MTCLLNVLPSPMAKGSKRPVFEFYTQPSTSRVAATTSVKNVHFSTSSQRDDCISARTSYIVAPASPQKKGRLENEDLGWADELPPEQSFLEDLQNPAYLSYIAEIALEDTPRKRTPAVRIQCRITMLLLTHLNCFRIIQSKYGLLTTSTTI